MSVPKHLTYPSFEAWAAGENLPKDWMRYPDAKQRAVWFAQFSELKEHLWAKHIATLPVEEQRQFTDHTHPSLSHRFKDRAQPFTSELKEELARLGYSAEVEVGFYHLDRIVLSAKVEKATPDQLHGVPWLFRGFEVKYLFPVAK